MSYILMFEDDESLINGLSFAIEKAGYDITIARTSAEMYKLWSNENYDLVFLDVSLPDGDGFDLCTEIRKTSKVPIIFLTAADEEAEIVMGLDIGGDDYITKPFKLAVLMSRVNALLRRSQDYRETGGKLISNGISVDQIKGEVWKNDEKLDLTASEYKLLVYLMENAGITLSPEQILGHLWDYDERYVDTNTLTVYIRRLRSKIEDNPGDPMYILTVRGRGYKWNQGIQR